MATMSRIVLSAMAAALLITALSGQGRIVLADAGGPGVLAAIAVMR